MAKSKKIIPKKVYQIDDWIYVSTYNRFLNKYDPSIFFDSAADFNKMIWVHKTEEESNLLPSDLVKRNFKNIVWDISYFANEPIGITRILGQKFFNIPDKERLAEKIKFKLTQPGFYACKLGKGKKL